MIGKNLKRAAAVSAFIIVFIYLFIHLTYVFREPLSHTREHMMGFYSEKKNTVDVVVLGTSCTFSAIAPMQMWEDYGIAAYDFCTNVLLEDTMKYALREIKKTQSPKLIIIDTAPFMNAYIARNGPDNTQIMRYNIDGFRISKNRIDLINSVIADKEKRMNYYFDLLYHHSNPEPEVKNWNWNRSTPYKGYSNLQIDVGYPDEHEDVNVPADKYPISDAEQRVLDDLLDEIDALGFNVLFITDPYWPVDNKEEAMGRAEYLQVYLTGKGYDFLDMHEYLDDIGIKGSEDYSMDYNHYTITGAIKNTRFLGGYIHDKYDLPDRRNDSGYDKWRREYDEWVNIVLPENIKWTNDAREEYLSNQSRD